MECSSGGGEHEDIEVAGGKANLLHKWVQIEIQLLKTRMVKSPLDQICYVTCQLAQFHLYLH